MGTRQDQPGHPTFPGGTRLGGTGSIRPPPLTYDRFSVREKAEKPRVEVPWGKMCRRPQTRLANEFLGNLSAIEK